jgi:hypothetical protein
MKNLSLSQTCLLDVSGELGPQAARRLHTHVDLYPAAHLEYELIRSRFNMLRSLPRFQDQADEAAKTRVAESIKSGIHAALREQRRQQRHRQWSRLCFQALSVASGMAACLVIAGGIYAVQMRTLARHQRMLDAESAFRDVAHASLPNQPDSTYAVVSHEIAALRATHGLAATSSIGNIHMMRLLQALDKVATAAASSATGQPSE